MEYVSMYAIHITSMDQLSYNSARYSRLQAGYNSGWSWGI